MLYIYTERKVQIHQSPERRVQSKSQDPPPVKGQQLYD